MKKKCVATRVGNKVRVYDYKVERRKHIRFPSDRFSEALKANQL